MLPERNHTPAISRVDQLSDEQKKQEEQPPPPHKKKQQESKDSHIKIGLREVIVGVILLVVGGIGALIVHLHSNGNGPAEGEPPPPPQAHHAITRVPTICTIRGIPDDGYLNATLTGTTKSVVAVAVWIVDDHHWYFKQVRHQGASWSAPPDPKHLWEVGRPGDPPRTKFAFAMLVPSKRAYEKGVYHQLPGEGEGRRTIPVGFRIVGETVDQTKRELLAGGFHRRCADSY
jgi:hypothetical protein